MMAMKMPVLPVRSFSPDCVTYFYALCVSRVYMYAWYACMHVSCVLCARVHVCMCVVCNDFPQFDLRWRRQRCCEISVDNIMVVCTFLTSGAAASQYIVRVGCDELCRYFMSCTPLLSVKATAYPEAALTMSKEKM